MQLIELVLDRKAKTPAPDQAMAVIKRRTLDPAMALPTSMNCERSCSFRTGSARLPFASPAAAHRSSARKMGRTAAKTAAASSIRPE
jgi:hypothetical protein